MPRPPLSVTFCRVLAWVYVARCLVSLTLANSSGASGILLGRWVVPVWSNIVLAAIAIACVMLTAKRGLKGLIACAVPISMWLGQTLSSPESYTAWFWFPRGGPTEPWGIPREFTYQFRYRSYEQLAGACAMTVAIEIVLSLLLLRLLTSRSVREYFWSLPTSVASNPSPSERRLPAGR